MTLTPKDIQKDLKLSKNTVYKLLSQNIIPSIKIGNSYRITEDEYNKWKTNHINHKIII